jgi:hypothetical protein
VVSSQSRHARQQVAETVRGLFAEGLTQADRLRGLAEIERLVAELYGIEPADLLASDPGDQEERHA